jgi:murein DD-endopeptidase MepM/ murein hydrolase activator NlpD
MSIRCRVWPRLLLVTLLVALLSVASLGSLGAAETDRLAENAERLAEVRMQIEQTAGQVEADASALAEAEQQLAVVVEAVEAASQAVQRQQQAVDDANARCEAAAAALVEQRRAAGGRAIERYKHGTESSLQAMLVADDPAEVLSRSAYLEIMGMSDRQTSETLEAAFTSAEAACRAVQQEEEVLQAVLEQERRILADAEAIRNERGLRLAASNEQLAQLQAQEDILAGDSRELGTLARRTSQGALTGLSGPGPNAGGWCWPSAATTTTSEFGPRWGRMHEGLDIAGGSGTPIYAAQAGLVTFAGRQGGYGNLMLIDHGGGIVTAYAHQSRFVASPGDMVECGQLIGEIGSTGNSTGPHLHFEVRVNGSARNPRSYL